MPNARHKNKKCVSLWLSKEELAKLNETAEKSGTTKTQVILDALSDFIRKNPNDSKKSATTKKNTVKSKKNPENAD